MMPNINKEAVRVGGIEKLDAIKLLKGLGFIYERGTVHDHYVYYLEGGESILWDNKIQNKITIPVGRGSLTTLRPQEARSIRKALDLLGEGHLWNKLIGLPMKKKPAKVKEKIPFFSSWANGFEKTFKALTFDRSVSDIEKVLLDIYKEEALKDDPTLIEDSLKQSISSLMHLVSNNESHYVSSLSTSDILMAISLLSSIQSKVDIEGILEMLGEGSEKFVEVEKHIEYLTDKEIILNDGEISLTEEGSKISNASKVALRLLKLSKWLEQNHFKKESGVICTFLKGLNRPYHP